MSRVLYFDTFSGISGDMCLSALMDLGVDIGVVREAVALIAPAQVTISTKRVKVHGISALRTTVSLDADAPAQPRNYRAIVEAIQQSTLAPAVKRVALDIFAVLAEAEAQVHGTTTDEVHFHEVGAWDSIADIVGFAAAFVSLNVDKVACSPVPVGTGFVVTRHGTMPLPAPATALLLQDIPTKGTAIQAELTTPTGAAIVKAVADHFGPLPSMVVQRVGWGAGHRELSDRPNLLRLFLGAESEAQHGEWLLETNIDDTTAEILGHVQGVLLEKGALDVWMTPVYMKKNRPGVQLSLICASDQVAAMKRLLFSETTAIGLREYPAHRTRLERRMETVATALGEVAVKVALLDGEVVNRAPEFEDVRRLAATHGIPVKQAWLKVLADL